MGKVKLHEPEGFCDFWAAWMPFRRKNDGRGDAREVYRKHILQGAEPADIIDGAKAYLRSLTEKERPYIPLAATWLNREAYADFVEEERTYQQRLEAARAKRDVAPPSNVHILQQPDNRPSEEERAAQVARLLGRQAAQG